MFSCDDFKTNLRNLLAPQLMVFTLIEIKTLLQPGRNKYWTLKV